MNPRVKGKANTELVDRFIKAATPLANNPDVFGRLIDLCEDELKRAEEQVQLLAVAATLDPQMRNAALMAMGRHKAMQDIKKLFSILKG